MDEDFFLYTPIPVTYRRNTTEKGRLMQIDTVEIDRITASDLSEQGDDPRYNVFPGGLKPDFPISPGITGYPYSLPGYNWDETGLKVGKATLPLVFLFPPRM